MVGPECSQTPCICLEWVQETFHVGLGPQPMHPDTICSPGVIKDFSQFPKLWANKYGEVGMMANPSAHPQDMNVLKRSLYMFEVGVGTIPCGSGASDNAT